MLLAMAAAASVPGPSAGAGPGPGSEVGATYEITRIRETSTRSGDSPTGSSYDRDTIVERVVGVRADGLELEYDLPKAARAEERADNWQFPVRIFRPRRGPQQLLNAPELEVRVDRWLKRAKWPRSVCGHWMFTWTGFRIECDPQSVVALVDSFDLRSADVREGASYREPGARAPGTLASKASSAGGATFAAEMEADPDAVRRTRAEIDVAVGEIMRKPVTLDAALGERAKEAVSGTISVTFETDAAGRVRRRTSVTRLRTRKPDGPWETETVTETLERRPLARP
jgi:hypothetical protein